MEESEAQQQPHPDDSGESDAEGGPGVFVGGHTGHAAANLAAQQRARGGAAARNAQPGAGAEAGTEETQTEMQDGEDLGAEDSFEQRDMDADIEDLD